MGTPLMWATAFYLLIGNALIGVVEGAIIVRYFQTAVRRTVALAILANYLSCLAGLFAMALVSGAEVAPGSLWAGLWAFLAAVALAFAVTVVLEWPFALLALPPRAAEMAPRVQGHAARSGLLVRAAFPLLPLGESAQPLHFRINPARRLLRSPAPRAGLLRRFREW